jgi:hypothetical protein
MRVTIPNIGQMVYRLQQMKQQKTVKHPIYKTKRSYMGHQK